MTVDDDDDDDDNDDDDDDDDDMTTNSDQWFEHRLPVKLVISEPLEVAKSTGPCYYWRDVDFRIIDHNTSRTKSGFMVDYVRLKPCLKPLKSDENDQEGGNSAFPLL
ncbi:hypothetical protein G9A89_004040 [Geosiphon pyriformis]|nr:hypothetical protein G9A89_004040 [Geosiphon pyriformis]